MPRSSLPLLLVLLALAAPASAQVERRYERTPDGWVRHEQGLVFPVLPDVVSAQIEAEGDELAALLAELGARNPLLAGLAVRRQNRLGVADLALPAGRDPLAVVAALRASGRVAFAEEATAGFYSLIPDDPQFPFQWHLHNTGTFGGTPDADMDAPEAWELEDGDPSIVVAVLDSGSEWTHPDLDGNVWANPGEVLNGLDDDGNGFVDDVRGWDFPDGDNDPSGPFFHGTAVAGCVAAETNNATQVASLAGGASDGQGSRVMICNVGDFSPDASILDDAILYALDNGAHIVTMSLTVPQSAAIDLALQAAHAGGVFLDCAAGNGGFSVTYPASHPLVMAVASTNAFDDHSGFSNPGPEVEVAAPGEDITMLSTGGGTTSSSGTSFAAPQVAGLAALLLSADPSLSNEQVRQILRDTADDVDVPGFDNNTGFGRINAHAALSASPGIAGEAQPYGQGLPGFGGQVPQIGVPTVPTVGRTTFTIVLGNARPSAFAYLLLGIGSASLPFAGGQILVDLGLQPNLIVAAFTTPLGRAAVAAPIPPDPALAGLVFYAQWVVVDPDAVFGHALTGGLQLTIGS